MRGGLTFIGAQFALALIGVGGYILHIIFTDRKANRVRHDRDHSRLHR